MFTRFIAPLKNILFDQPFDFGDFTITNEKDFATTFLAYETTIELIGTMSARTIFSDNIAFFEVKDEYISDDPIRIAKKFNDTLYLYSAAFWFVKDNSIYNYKAYAGKIEGVGGDYRGLFRSNAKGLFEPEYFSPEDLKKAKAFIELVVDYSSIEHVEQREDLPIIGGKEIVANSSFIPYNSINRLTKALMFLDSARTETLLPKKIAFYIMVLETLFVTDNVGVSKKVIDRATFFTTDNLDNKCNTYITLKNSYDIRSKYFHGDELKGGFSSREKQVENSISIDVIVRKALIKALTNCKQLFKTASDIEDYFSNGILLTNKEKLKEIGYQIGYLNGSVMSAELDLMGNEENSTSKSQLEGTKSALKNKILEYDLLLEKCKIDGLESQWNKKNS